MLRVNDVVVIGGGVAGASAAYHLARDRARVTLVDRQDEGQATAAGAGIVSPGTDLGPPDPYFPLAFHAVGFYDRLKGELIEDGVREFGYETCGLLHVAVSEEEARRLPNVLRIIKQRREAGAPAVGDIHLLDARQAESLFPPIRRLHGAIYASGAGRVDGRKLRDSLLQGAGRRGASLVRGSAELVVERGRAVGVRVAGRLVFASAVVIASGAWTDSLGAAGAYVPVRPQRGQIAHLTVPDTRTASWPIVVGFYSHYLLTFPQNRVVAGATREDGVGFDYSTTAGGVQEVLSEALRIAPGLASAQIGEFRIGFRPVSPDGLPVIGPVPGVENAYIVSGLGAHGLQLGPYCGYLAAAMAQGLPISLDLSAFSPARFA